QPVMDRLKIPLDLTGGGFQADQRLSEQVCAGTGAAIVVAARRRSWQIEESARFIESHGRPDVAVAAGAPRFVLPTLGSGIFCGLRNHRESPCTLAGVRIERLHVP